MDVMYKLTLNLTEHSFGIESNDREWVESKQKELLQVVQEQGLAAGGGAKAKPGRSNASLDGASITIQEYYKKYVQPNSKISRPDLAVLLIYYLEKVKSQSEIKTGDVASAFGAIGYPGYNKINFSDVLLNARKKGFLNYVNNNWTLTLTGEDFTVDRLSAAE